MLAATTAGSMPLSDAICASDVVNCDTATRPRTPPRGYWASINATVQPEISLKPALAATGGTHALCDIPRTVRCVRP